MENNEFQKIRSKILAKTWRDPQFKKRLLENPENILKEEGIDVPKGKKVSILEETDSQLYFVVPQRPSGALTEEELEAIAGGYYNPTQEHREEAWHRAQNWPRKGPPPYVG